MSHVRPSGSALHTYGRFTVGDHVSTPTLRSKGIRKARITAIGMEGSRPVFTVIDHLFGDAYELRFEELDG